MRTVPLAIALALAACQGSSDSNVPAQPDAGAMMMRPDAAGSAACVPTTCAARGAECGKISDGCGRELDCGYCVFQSDDCEANQCVCQPSCYMRECGNDGCGGTCGSCDANESCSPYGKCKYEGAGATPPASWHCNAAYYDNGDGCDCNCGALDPDCGQGGQSLHGCTGLDSPTCNAQGLCTGGGNCHAVPGSAYLTHYMVIQGAPTMFGGTIASGRYEGTEMRSYNPPGGISGHAGGDGVAIEINGSTWRRMRRPVGGYDPVDETFTASVSGNTITLTRTCPSASTQTYTFTTSSTQLVLAQPAGSGTKVITFTKRW